METCADYYTLNSWRSGSDLACDLCWRGVGGYLNACLTYCSDKPGNGDP